MGWREDRLEAIVGVLESDAALAPSVLVGAVAEVVAVEDVVGQRAAQLGMTAGELAGTVAGELAGALLGDAMRVASKLVADVGAAIPIAGQIVSVLAGVVGLIEASAEAARQARLRAQQEDAEEQARECLQSMEFYETAPTGAAGLEPVDMFLRRERVLGVDGQPIWTPVDGPSSPNATGMPAMGRLLVALTEQPLPYVAYERAVKAAWLEGRGYDPPEYHVVGGATFAVGVAVHAPGERPGPAALGGATVEADYWYDICGISRAKARELSGVSSDPNEAADPCAGRIWPLLDEERVLWGRLNRALMAQARAPLDEADAADSGRALWAVYMDLLYLATHAQRWPLGADEAGTRPEVPYPPAIIRQLWSLPLWSWRPGVDPRGGHQSTVARPAVAEHLSHLSCTWPQTGTRDVLTPGASHEGLWWVRSLFPPCSGDWTTLTEQLLGWIRKWGYATRPADLDEAERQADEAIVALGELGKVSTAGGGGSAGGGGAILLGAAAAALLLMRRGQR